MHLFVERKYELYLVRIMTSLVSEYLQDGYKDLQISEMCIETYFELLLK